MYISNLPFPYYVSCTDVHRKCPASPGSIKRLQLPSVEKRRVNIHLGKRQCTLLARTSRLLSPFSFFFFWRPFCCINTAASELLLVLAYTSDFLYCTLFLPVPLSL